MPPVIRSPLTLSVLIVLVPALVSSLAAFSSEARSAPPCVHMSVSSAPVEATTSNGRRHYRIQFQNRCETQRVVYWCAIPPEGRPGGLQSGAPACARESTRQPVTAAPLYAVHRQREFQWVLPEGTLIRYVDCPDASLPDTSLRCADPSARSR